MRRIAMSLFIMTVLILAGIYSCALPVDQEAEKKAITDLQENWNQMFLTADTSMLKSFFPEDHTKYGIIDMKIEEDTYEKSLKHKSKLFSVMKFTRLEFTEEPMIFVSPDGNMAAQLATGVIDYQYLKSGRSWKSRFTDLVVLEKKNGQWVDLAGSSHYMIEQEGIEVDVKLLKEYAGKYKMQTSDRISEYKVEDRQLVIVLKDKTEPLTATADEVFFQKGSVSQTIFCRNKKGKVDHVIWAGKDFSSKAFKIK